MAITGGQAVVRALADHGVTTLFGVPTNHSMTIVDALNDAPGIHRVVVRHEQSAVFMADGYARASGRLGACLTGTGPGALNGLAAMLTAYSDSSPVLNLVTQVPLQHIGAGKGYVHEVQDQLAMLRPVTRWRSRAYAPHDIPRVIGAAVAAAMHQGRPGPVAVELPVDVLESSGPSSSLQAVVASTGPVPQQARPADVATAAELLRSARRRLIWAGGGAVSGGAAAVLAQLAEMLGAPVLTSLMGKGSIASDHPLCLGNVALQPALEELLEACDALLVVGSRLSAFDTGHWSIRLPERIIQIDIDREEIGRNYPVACALVGDAATVLRQLLGQLQSEHASAPDGSTLVKAMRRRVRDDLEARSADGVRMIDGIRAALPRDAIVVNDVTIGAYWGWALLEVYKPRTYLYPCHAATLGFGLPAALGAKLAQPDRTVLAICGDGGFMYTAAELATAVFHGLDVVVLVVNDRCFGIFRERQRKRFGRTSMIELGNPDFLAFARSFGANAMRVASVAELPEAIRWACSTPGPTVVEIPIQLPPPFED